MLCLVLSLTLTTVGAREMKFLTGKDALNKCAQYSALDDKEAIGALSTKDPLSPNMDDTVSPPSVTPRVRSWSSSVRRGQTSIIPSGRRANKLVESLRRQLMNDSYDYLSNESAENSSITSSNTISTTTRRPTATTEIPTIKTTKVTTLNEIEMVHAMEAKYASSPKFDPVLTTPEAGKYVARTHSQMQVASINLQKLPMSAASVDMSPSARSSKVLRSYVAPQYPAAGHQPPSAYLPAVTTVYSNAASDLPAADHSSIAGHHPTVYNPAADYRPKAGHPSPVAPARPVESSDRGLHPFRTFEEAYNMSSPIRNQLDTEPKREVFNKDLLYYVDDGKLNRDLHLRGNNYLSSDVNQAQDREDHYGDSATFLSAQSSQDINTAFDSSQQMIYGQQLRRNNQRGSMYKRLRGKKNKHSEKIKSRPVDSIKKRAKLYGLRPKQYGPSRYMKTYAHQKQSRSDKERYDEDIRRREGMPKKRNHPYNTSLHRRNNNKVIYGRQSPFGAEFNDKAVHEIHSQNSTTNRKKTTTHVTQYGDQETNVQIDGNNDKKQSINSTDEHNNLNEIKDEYHETQDVNNKNENDTNDDEMNLNEEKKDTHEDNDGTVHKIDNQYEVSQLEDAKDDNSNDEKYYSPFVEETTSNVKYKLLKVRSLGGSRRSESRKPHHILQERGSQGVALISLDQAPFPQFQLPLARRQYMQETINARHPLMEQLPKLTSKRSY